MANSGPIPILHPTQNYSNAYYNQGFTNSPFNSPQSPPYYMDPRSPRTIFSMPAPMQIPIPPTRGRFVSENRNSPASSSTEEGVLYKKIIAEILEDVANGLDDDFWGCLTYMEYNHCVVSTYTRGTDFIVDNSANPMNSTSLGLSNLPSRVRHPISQSIRHAIHKGIVLSSDEEGNIYLKNESKVPVIIKGFDQPENCCISEEVIRLRGSIKPGNEFVMIFDMEEFRSQIGLQIVNGYKDEQQLNYLSLIRLCFGEVKPGLNSPCWILLANLKALKMSNSDEVRTEMENTVARLKVTSNQQIKKHLSSKKKTFENKQEALRKTRIELRRQGQKITDHMKYSWNDVYFKNEASSLNIETLKEEFEDPAIDYDGSEEDEVITPQEEPQRQSDLERLKTLVRNKPTSSVSTKVNQQPVKHWAKLSYMVKRHSAIEGVY